MKICLLGDCTGNIDEGMKKITFNLASRFSLLDNYDILVLDPRRVFFKNFWKNIKDFDPYIIHYIPGPSLKSFLIVKIISLYIKDVKFIMSAPFPRLSKFSKKLIHLFKPDLMLVQSRKTEKIFKEKGFRTKFLPLSGVDVKKFTPVPTSVKEELREKYGIDKDKFVVLHVGHIRRGRNIQIFKKIQKENGIQVVIVGSTSTGMDTDLYYELKRSGCHVIIDYVKNVEEIYQLSDCYVFPTISRSNSIELPLSVLEAMACNLPVISTRFGALPECFTEGDGLIFVRSEEQIFSALNMLKEEEIKIANREKVLSYSWENIIKILAIIYKTLYNGEY